MSLGVDTAWTAGYSDRMTTTTTNQTAHVTDHVYRDGYGRSRLDKPFYMVQCDECMVVLNSGHHWTDRALAQRWADEHNAEKHAATVSVSMTDADELRIIMALVHEVENLHRSYHAAGPFDNPTLTRDAARAYLTTLRKLAPEAAPIGGSEPYAWHNCLATCPMRAR